MADTLLKAQLVPIDRNTKEALVGQAIPVHFNPETLKLAYTINTKADTASKNSSDQAAQQVSNSTAKLAVDLVFDTTDLFEKDQDEADVRKKVTNKIVELFVAPPAPGAASDGQPIPANPCLFLWGTFQFVGVVDSYNETLEFFSASGVPLRAAVSLSLSENRYKVTVGRQERVPGKAQSLPQGGQLGLALSNAGMDPTDWRNTALANGMETPRFSARGSIDISIGASLGASASAAGGAGFSIGASADLGTGIAGAFANGGNAGAGFSAGASFG
jgi:Contractile injection system tube protein